MTTSKTHSKSMKSIPVASAARVRSKPGDPRFRVDFRLRAKRWIPLRASATRHLEETFMNDLKVALHAALIDYEDHELSKIAHETKISVKRLRGLRDGWTKTEASPEEAEILAEFLHKRGLRCVADVYLTEMCKELRKRREDFAADVLLKGWASVHDELVETEGWQPGVVFPYQQTQDA